MGEVVAAFLRAEAVEQGAEPPPSTSATKALISLR